MFKYLREDIKALQAYEVKELPWQIKLDANEGVDWMDGLNRYPADRSDELRGELAQILHKDPDELLLGNGSSELIELCLKAYLEAGETVASIGPTFSMYRIFTIIHKGRYAEFPLTDMTTLNVEGFIRFVRETKPKLVLLSNPNNPTGSFIPRADLRRIIEAVDAMVILDEAYIEFADEPVSDDTRIYPNLLVLRTFSKSLALAGIRLGYMIGSKENIGEINRVRSPYNVNVLTQAAGLKALAGRGQAEANNAMIRAQRQRMSRELTARGYDPLPSQANFLMFPASAGLGEALARRGILIRTFGGALSGWCRLTIGTPAENDRVLAALDEIRGETEPTSDQPVDQEETL